ncbi:MAG: hypothetical protein U5K77_01610 [Candidatus Saccharibacteria bacterium]|nr:hypothetical protein [Candidatus Saccharibacteria bacterium]
MRDVCHSQENPDESGAKYEAELRDQARRFHGIVRMLVTDEELMHAPLRFNRSVLLKRYKHPDTDAAVEVGRIVAGEQTVESSVHITYEPKGDEPAAYEEFAIYKPAQPGGDWFTYIPKMPDVAEATPDDIGLYGNAYMARMLQAGELLDAVYGEKLQPQHIYGYTEVLRLIFHNSVELLLPDEV